MLSYSVRSTGQRQVNMKWLSKLCLFCFVSRSISMNYDYDSTPMEDPLQPIWQRLEYLSSDIKEGFEDQMKVFMGKIEENIESKFQSLKSEMNNRTQTDGNTRLINEIKSTISTWLENHLSNVNNNSAIESAAGSIKVSIDALENKLIEHINVKCEQLSGGARKDNSSSGTTAIIPSSPQMSEIESRITSHITTKLNDIENSISHQLMELSSTLSSISSTLATVNTHANKIEEITTALQASISTAGAKATTTSAGGTSQSCSDLVTTVSELMNRPQLSTEFLNQQESRWKEMQTVIAEVRETPSFLPRDCSDIHWLHHEAATGVYEIYPTLDRKSNVLAYCDMGDTGDKTDGGWTVILRRQNTDFGLVDFNRTWQDYVTGFGDPAEGEWWFSLYYLHVLTYRQPYHVSFIMKDIEDGTFVAEYTTFRVEDEDSKFRLIVDGFSGNVTNDAFQTKHHGRNFSTPDQDNDNWADGNCALNNSGGWWYNACHYVTLTAPFPTSNDREAKTIRWRNNEKWLVLNDVTIRIRPVNYGQRFNPHGYEEKH